MSLKIYDGDVDEDEEFTFDEIGDQSLEDVAFLLQKSE